MHGHIDAGHGFDVCLHRLDLQLTDVRQTEGLVGDVVGLDLVVVPQVQVLDSELGQAKRDAGTCRPDANDIDAALSPLLGIEELPMSCGIENCCHPSPPFGVDENR